MPKLRGVIIGMGNIGFRFSLIGNKFHTTHFEAYWGSPDVELVGVADINAELRAQVGDKFKGSVYADYRELLLLEKPEIVSICTPDDTHFSIFKDVVATPSVKVIWCEKPLAISISEAGKMVDACKRRGIKLVVNFPRRYDSFYAYIGNNLEKLLGGVQAVAFYYSGGIVTTGSHMLDLLSLLFGKCNEVSAVNWGTGLWGRLKFGKIPVTIIPMDTGNYSIFEIDISGEKGRLDTINKPFGEYDYRYYAREEARVIPAKFVARKSESLIPRNFPRSYMDEALRDVVRVVRDSGEPLSSGMSALQSLEIMHALIYSAEHGGKVVEIPFNGKVKNLPQSGGDMHRKMNN